MAAKAVEQATGEQEHRKPHQADNRNGGWQDMLRKAAATVGGTSTDSTAPGGASHRPQASAAPAASGQALSDADRAAIARYDYLLQTADPHQIERIHQDAFERLSPAQRAEVHARMRAELPAQERPTGSDASALARAGTRAEAMNPGFLRGLLGRTGRRSGQGTILGAGVGAAGGVLAAVAGGAVLSTVAGPLLEQAASFGVDFEALAGQVDLEAMTGTVGDAIGGAGETLSGLGEQAGGISEQLSNPDLPNLGDIFGQ